MHHDILSYIQAQIRVMNYIMTVHAEEEMENDGLSIYDIEQAVRCGSIIERQIDQRTTEWKYIIQGETDLADTICVVTKISPTGVLVIITIYALN